MEKVQTDDDDRPLQAVTISKATIFVNPYKEMEDAEKKQEQEERLQVKHSFDFLSRANLEGNTDNVHLD